MKINLKLKTLIISLILFSFSVSAQETEKNQITTEVNSSEIEKNVFPKSIGIVNDYGEILTESQSAEL
ncbi:hypothetical protein [Bizionia myxarmorum]|uniref:hypothetical protein n=1 Tax=Bizionia myxarmorum TaxID=291186 RepID=UPI001FECFCDE|nr:hypothetical protein [Bizionia myxarmorum]